jgi:hypothetical protein
MSKPIRLNDDELNHIFEAARPLPVERRDAFLQEVASLLSRCGPGTVHRAIQQAQRLYFDPPHNQPGPSRARWDRDEPKYERQSKAAV